MKVIGVESLKTIMIDIVEADVFDGINPDTVVVEFVETTKSDTSDVSVRTFVNVYGPTIQRSGELSAFQRGHRGWDDPDGFRKSAPAWLIKLVTETTGEAI